MKKKILKFLIPFLGLTTVAAATAPIIVSCSSGPTEPSLANPGDIVNGSKPAPGIDQNVFNTILKHTFGEKLPPDELGSYDYQNKISSQFGQQAQNSQEPKTMDEALQIAQDNLNNITDAELQETLNLNFAKGLTYAEVRASPSDVINVLSLASLSNLRFDRIENEISFNINIFVSQSSVSKIAYKSENRLEYRFNNIKIKPSVIVTNSNVIPSIGFDQNQPNASLTLVKSDVINNVLEVGSEAWDKDLIPQELKKLFKTKDKYIKYIKFFNELNEKQYKQCLGKQLGVVENKFSIIVQNYSIFNESFIPIRGGDFAWIGWDMSTNTSAALQAVEIAFSSMNPETNQSQWQVFKKAI